MSLNKKFRVIIEGTLKNTNLTAEFLKKYFTLEEIMKYLSNKTIKIEEC